MDRGGRGGAGDGWRGRVLRRSPPHRESVPMPSRIPRSNPAPSRNRRPMGHPPGAGDVVLKLGRGDLVESLLVPDCMFGASSLAPESPTRRPYSRRRYRTARWAAAGLGISWESRAEAMAPNPGSQPHRRREPPCPAPFLADQYRCRSLASPEGQAAGGAGKVGLKAMPTRIPDNRPRPPRSLSPKANHRGQRKSWWSQGGDCAGGASLPAALVGGLDARESPLSD